MLLALPSYHIPDSSYRCEKLFSWHIFLLSLCISWPALHCMCFAQRAWKLPHLMTTSHVPRDATLRTNRLTLHLCAAISTEDAAWSEQHISLQMSVFFPSIVLEIVVHWCCRAQVIVCPVLKRAALCVCVCVCVWVCDTYQSLQWQFWPIYEGPGQRRGRLATA